MIKRIFISTVLIFSSVFLFAQGYNHTWLLGYGNWANKGRINFSTNAYQFVIEQRDMRFLDTQGNISDLNGNFLMSSNGVWIANSLNDTMLNGSGLNPSGITSSWDALPIFNSNVILPWPANNNIYALFHHTATFDGFSYPTLELYYSLIDITGDSGLGEVTTKNNVFFQDTLGWGYAVCKHANGRDWWIVVLKNESDIIYKFLLTPTGISTVISQSLNVPNIYYGNGQPVFSPDGSKFAYTSSVFVNGNYNHDVRVFNFDRCTGIFSNPQVIDITDSIAGFGTAFSANSKYLYASSFQRIFQLNTDTSDIAASLATVAVYDGFMSGFPPSCCATDFWLMYLAANGKIYLTSGSGTQHLHEINFPDIGGLGCDVQQHSISLGIWQASSVPNHPNYYLGCDTTLACTPCYVSVNEVIHDFRFNIYPNPSSGNFNIIYLLPQNKEGKLEVFDITGKVVYELRLPQWSTLQSISLPSFISNGLYNCVITSEGKKVSRKIAVIKD